MPKKRHARPQSGNIRRLVWLCRDPDPPLGGWHSARRFEHKMFSGKPQLLEMPSGERSAFCATDRAVYLGEILLPVRGLPAFGPGEGQWVLIAIDV